MKLDVTKPVQTRDGRKARILATDVKDVYPVVAAVADGSGSEEVKTYTLEGKFDTNEHSTLGRYDLINVPEKVSGYVNVYRSTAGEFSTNMTIYPDRDTAGRRAAMERIACIRIEFTVGQFDE